MLHDTTLETGGHDVRIGSRGLKGRLTVPREPRGLVVFVHDSGSGRDRRRETVVADALGRRGFATLLFDLLDEVEARDCANVFDVNLLARRLQQALAWTDERPDLRGLSTCLFGASTGAAAALVTAAAEPARIASVVSIGGRPDLVDALLRRVRAPVLLIVGGGDPAVLGLNGSALARLSRQCRLEVVPRARHLFQEPGALERVSALAGDWFDAHCQEPVAM